MRSRWWTSWRRHVLPIFSKRMSAPEGALAKPSFEMFVREETSK
jgi:hypothetical protein